MWCSLICGDFCAANYPSSEFSIRSLWGCVASSSLLDHTVLRSYYILLPGQIRKVMKEQSLIIAKERMTLNVKYRIQLALKKLWKSITNRPHTQTELFHALWRSVLIEKNACALRIAKKFLRSGCEGGDFHRVDFVVILRRLSSHCKLGGEKGSILNVMMSRPGQRWGAKFHMMGRRHPFWLISAPVFHFSPAHYVWLQYVRSSQT